MPPNKFHIVDVFAPSKYAGNQLAVFHDTANISDENKQRLAREMNYSEVTFIESLEPSERGYDVRIFDPVTEMDFAGHPTLGTAYVLREFVREDRPDQLTLDLKVGQIPVRIEEQDGTEQYWMRQVPPTFGRTFDRELLARVLGLDEQDLDDEYPIQLVSTGLPTVIVPVESLDAVRHIQIDYEAYYEEFIDRHGERMVLCFAPETIDDAHDLHVRVFADYSDVPEDPATGSSNGCLAAYLVEHEFLDVESIDVTVEQGYEIDRPSHLYLRAEPDNGAIVVEVGGTVEPVAEGHLV